MCPARPEATCTPAAGPDRLRVAPLLLPRAPADAAGPCRAGAPGLGWPVWGRESNGRRRGETGHLSPRLPFCGVTTRLAGSLRGSHKPCPAVPSTQLCPEVSVAFSALGPFRPQGAGNDSSSPPHPRGSVLASGVPLGPAHTSYTVYDALPRLPSSTAAVPAWTPTDTQARGARGLSEN